MRLMGDTQPSSRENECVRAGGVEIRANVTAQELFKHGESSEAIWPSPSLALREEREAAGAVMAAGLKASSPACCLQPSQPSTGPSEQQRHPGGRGGGQGPEEGSWSGLGWGELGGVGINVWNPSFSLEHKHTAANSSPVLEEPPHKSIHPSFLPLFTPLSSP